MTGPALAPPDVVCRRTADGGWALRSAQPLDLETPTVLHRLRHWAEAAPERTFLAERDDTGGWRRLAYGEAARRVERVAQGLLERGVGPRAAVAILSENELNNAVLRLAAMTVGAAVVPVSPSYSLLSRDFARLRAIVALTEPALVYVEDVARYAPALAALDAPPRVVASRNADAYPGAEPFERLAAAPTGAVAAASGRVTPDAVAAIFFTSGSTGQPKGVITTQRMICANQQAIAQVWPFLAERPPVLLDWLPWHHTFGGNDNLHKMLWHGGTLYVDRGRPTPDGFEESIANLRKVSPTRYINVPRGLELLLPRLERDAEL
ncbi:MAG TPA: AMP-binding protein, partial [Geminicoccaceae bacterium]|nr:AMP-binding protein [Geminicoccaceae bacterium]